MLHRRWWPTGCRFEATIGKKLRKTLQDTRISFRNQERADFHDDLLPLWPLLPLPDNPQYGDNAITKMLGLVQGRHQEKMQLSPKLMSTFPRPLRCQETCTILMVCGGLQFVEQLSVFLEQTKQQQHLEGRSPLGYALAECAGGSDPVRRSPSLALQSIKPQSDLPIQPDIVSAEWMT